MLSQGTGSTKVKSVMYALDFRTELKSDLCLWGILREKLYKHVTAYEHK